MFEGIKKSADAGDIKSLKYIFVDCLDVDPTFEKYLDDYNYCVKKGLFEPHKNLNDFSNRQADWNDDYWQILKRDLLKNFSRERLDHMREVAPVVLADKVARLRQERQQQTQQPASPPISQPPVQQRPAGPPLKSKSQQQQEELEAAKRQLAQENATILAQENATIEQQRQADEHRRQENLRRQSEVAQPKKAPGIALWIAIAAVILAIAAVAPLIAVIAAVLAVIIYNLLK